MKTIIKSTLILIILISQNIAFGQKVEFHKFQFKYQQLPLQPLGRDVDNYIPNVVLGYTEVAQQMEANYNNDVKIANENYQRELDAYNKQSTLGKIVSQEILKQEKPIFIPLERPFIPKLHDTQALTKKYVVLEGYNVGKVNPILVTATINELEFKDLESSTKTRNKTLDGQTVVEQYRIYSISYKQPISLYIEKATTSSVIYNNFVPLTNQYYTKTYTNTIPENYKEEIEELILKSNMNRVYNYLNDNYTTKEASLYSEITYAVGKKHNYNDYKEALEMALSGFNLLTSDKISATSKLKQAISIWEKALKEFDPNNKKARINEKIGVATMMNVAEANLFIDNFDECEKYLTRASINNPSSAQLRRINYFRKLLEDLRKRYNANL